MQSTSRVSSAAGWVVIAVLFAATTCVESMSWNQLSAYTPLYLRELHVPAAQVPGWIAAMSSLGWILALPLAPFWGVFADRYSRKLVIVRSAALEAVIFAGWALSTGPWTALLFRCLSGFILGNTGVMLAVQASTTPKQRLALAVGIVAAGSPAGRAVGPILGAFLVHQVDIRGMLLFDAALSALMAVLLTVVMREGDHGRLADRALDDPALRAHLHREARPRRHGHRSGSRAVHGRPGAGARLAALGRRHAEVWPCSGAQPHIDGLGARTCDRRVQ